MRTYLAWCLRDWLNPANNQEACLPPEGRLAHELTQIRYFILNSGKIKLEEGYEVKKRLGYSPDEFDALKLTFSKSGEGKRMNIGSLLGRLP